MPTIGESSDVQRGMRILEESLPKVIDEAIAVCEVPAPTFEEGRRAEFVAQRMRQLQLGEPRRDAEGNVICELAGAAGRPTIVVMAHLDTVFGATTPIKVRREGNLLHGPGIGDNSMAVAAMLWLGRALRDLPGRGTLVLTANTGEEGLGNLRGARALWEQYGQTAEAWVAIEGAMSGEAVNLGIPSRRLEIAYHGLGGHSWRNFGRPSAIHALGALIAQIGQIKPPTEPKTTYNVGGITGGRSVNTIAQDAELLLDMRSEDGEALATLERRIRGLVAAIGEAFEMQAEIRVVGDRPGGRIAADHWLVRLVDEAARTLGQSLRWKSASTDGNVPLSHGAAAVTLGVAKGDNLHSVEEVLDVSDALRGLQLDYLALAGLLLGHRTGG
jgi:acetylornithine deacetylase/succinyl-diaminopimelate desuccinylase-like protein